MSHDSHIVAYRRYLTVTVGVCTFERRTHYSRIQNFDIELSANRSKQRAVVTNIQCSHGKGCNIVYDVLTTRRKRERSVSLFEGQAKALRKGPVPLHLECSMYLNEVGNNMSSLLSHKPCLPVQTVCQESSESSRRANLPENLKNLKISVFPTAKIRQNFPESSTESRGAGLARRFGVIYGQNWPSDHVRCGKSIQSTLGQ